MGPIGGPISVLNPLEVARAFPVGHGVVEGLRFQSRGVDVEFHRRFAECRARELAAVEQGRSQGYFAAAAAEAGSSSFAVKASSGSPRRRSVSASTRRLG